MTRNPLRRDIPLVVVCNISEAFVDFLNHASTPAERARLIKGEQIRGDRTLLWLGDPKLVIVSFPIPHADDFCRLYGYGGTCYITPQSPSPWLSRDILAEDSLTAEIVRYAGPAKAIQLIPYATTPQFCELAQALREHFGLQVSLPESPAPEAMWVRDYIDTKAGFHILASRWLSAADRLLPAGLVCQNLAGAAAVAHWYGLKGRTCIVKADDGENGIGNLIIRPGDFGSEAQLRQAISENPFMQNGWITVEQFIESSNLTSPSLELFVPPVGQGDPYITYLSDQVFLGYGDFCGVLVSRELTQAGWYPDLADSGLTIAQRLQEMGYVGHFDLDTVVDDAGNVFLLEINSRRTGGTHTHEFAEYFFGADYLDRISILSHDAMASGGLTDYASLRARIADLIYPMAGRSQGVIVTGTSALELNEFGCLIAAPTTPEVMQLRQQLEERLNGSH